MTNEVTEDSVRLAYRLLLEREPESEDLVRTIAARVGTIADLRTVFTGSREYMQKTGLFQQQLEDAYWKDRGPVDVDVTTATFAHLIERTRQQWGKLGNVDPYWSVLTNDEYRIGNMTTDSLKRFYETGLQSAKLLDIFSRRAGVTIPRGTCLELGCGVGRITRHLADRFDRVIAVDISGGNLQICRDYLAREGVTNVETRLIASPHDLDTIGPIDCFYSIIVLQHNPPPIQKTLLQSILSQLASGGVFLFQTPDTIPNYTFKEKDVVRLAEHVMDMHCLPKVVILKMLTALGLELRDVIIDQWTGAFGSYTYFGQRSF